MKNQGLKGVTDATTFCASMKKGGAKPMIRSMKSFEMGGTTNSMGAGVMSTDSMCGLGDGGCHKSRRRANNQRLKSAGVSRSNRRRMS